MCLRQQEWNSLEHLAKAALSDSAIVREAHLNQVGRGSGKGKGYEIPGAQPIQAMVHQQRKATVVPPLGHQLQNTVIISLVQKTWQSHKCRLC